MYPDAALFLALELLINLIMLADILTRMTAFGFGVRAALAWRGAARCEAATDRAVVRWAPIAQRYIRSLRNLFDLAVFALSLVAFILYLRNSGYSNSERAEEIASLVLLAIRSLAQLYVFYKEYARSWCCARPLLRVACASAPAPASRSRRARTESAVDSTYDLEEARLQRAEMAVTGEAS